MNKKQEQDLSRLLDGELPPGRAGDLEQAMAGSDELDRTRAAFREIGDLLRDQDIPDGKTGEVAWQDLQRALRLESSVPVPGILGSRLTWATAIMTVVFIILGVSVLRTGETRVAMAPAEVEWVDTEVPGATTMVYQDDETGLTVIWMLEEETESNGNVDS